MPSNFQDRDPYVLTTQWSRRFLGLRLFLSLAAAGWLGYATHVERSIELAQKLRQELTKCGWSIANESPLAVLCVVPPAGFPDVRLIAREIVASGLAWVSSTIFCKRDVLRLCITNGRTMPEDIHALVLLLQSFAHARAA
jgi:glutamate/tyrosine decarboxylase-like PLP-dependent enzyme